MKEIGGYIELDTYHLPMLHEDAIALNETDRAYLYFTTVGANYYIFVTRQEIGGKCGK